MLEVQGLRSNNEPVSSSCYCRNPTFKATQQLRHLKSVLYSCTYARMQLDYGQLAKVPDNRVTVLASSDNGFHIDPYYLATCTLSS